MFSTLHQSSLGSLFLLAPTKLHPLWYSPYISDLLLHLRDRRGLCDGDRRERRSRTACSVTSSTGQHVDVDKLTLGLGEGGGAIVLFAYFFLQAAGRHRRRHAWDLLATGYGAWFLFEMVGFVLVPALLFAYGARNTSAEARRGSPAHGRARDRRSTA